jgi:hypothetical protein
MPDMISGGITVCDVQPSMIDFMKRAGYRVVEAAVAEAPVVLEDVPQDLEPASEEPVKVVKKPTRKVVK